MGRLRKPRRGDLGYTLVEMLAVISVFGLVMALAVPGIVLVQRKTADLQITANSVSELRIAIQTMDRQSRSGNVLYSPSDEPALTAGCQAVGTNAGTCMRIYTQSNGDQRCVQWQVIPNPADTTTSVLRSRSWAQNWVATGNYSGWSVVARGLGRPASKAPFTLQGADTVYDSRLLDVHLEAIDTRRGQPNVISSSLSGRNTNYGYDPGVCTPVPPA